MSHPHVIRLRGPWEYEPLSRLVADGSATDGTFVARTDDLPPPGRITMPADWTETLGADFRGRVRYRRRFTCPTGLGPGDRLFLVVEGVDHRATLHLDEFPLGEINGRTAMRREITALLSGRHLLRVDVELRPMTDREEASLRPDRQSRGGGLVGEVRLEIEPSGAS